MGHNWEPRSQIIDWLLDRYELKAVYAIVAISGLFFGVGAFLGFYACFKLIGW